jgi:hypothetical protein
MLIDSLLQTFTAYFERDPDHDTILWFDPEREWEGLLPHLQPHLPLLIFDGSQLEIRHRLASRETGERFVVYLPLDPGESPSKRGEAEYLRPFFYTARRFDSSIETVLHEADAAPPVDYATMRQICPLLPALAVASVGKGKAFWTGIVNLETALAHLLPDFEDLLLRLLTAPAQTMAELQTRQAASPFFDLAAQQFGITAPETGEEDAWAASLPSMHQWADRFTATLCLVELYAAAGEPPDFPFRDVLPAPVHWGRCRAFLQTWQRDEMFKDAFARRARAIDGQYGLAAWVKALPQLPACGAFLNAERAIWERTREQLDGIGDKPQAIAFCRDQRETFARRARGFWAREGALAGWVTLAHMAEVVIGADDALAELARFPTVQSLVGRYTQAWQQVDRAYRRFRAEMDQGVSHVDAALKWTRRIYQDFLEAINVRLGEAIAQEGWTPRVGDLWSGEVEGRRGVVLVDALRYELGQELVERLQPGPQVTIDAALSPLPSVTPLGMAALLPRWPEFQVDYADGWAITAPGFEGNVAARAGRLGWLEAELAHVVTYDIGQWLSLPLGEVDPDAAWIVVTSVEIDAVGEGAATVAWHAFDALLDRLAQVVRRLLACGCQEVHIISDHGFLLRETIRESDKAAVDAPGALKKAERYLILIGQDLPPTDLPSLPVSGSEGLTAWFPRGVGCFVTPGPYHFMHGGISLQELVTAHVTARQSVTERPVQVALELLTGPEIRNAIFKIRLAPQGVDLWSRARSVKVDIARQGKQVSREWEAVVNRDPVDMSLMLSPTSGLAVGDAIAIRVWDAVTGELLAQQPAVLQVDLDL